MERVREAERTTLMPTTDDLRGTAIAIARLRNVYRLAISDLADGRLSDTTTSASRTSLATDFLLAYLPDIETGGGGIHLYLH